MAYEISTPVNFSAAGPVGLSLTNTTSGGGVVWNIDTDIIDNVVIGTNTISNDVIHLFRDSIADPMGATQAPRLRLKRGANFVNLDTDPGLSTSYTYNFPAIAPTPGQIMISTAGSNQFFNINPPNTLSVRLDPSSTEFSSIAAAIASIPVFPAPGFPSTTNRWVVYVYPGEYLEPAIIVPSFVFVVGESMEAVRVAPNALGFTLWTLTTATGVAFLSVRNTDPALPAIFIYNVSNIQGCILHKIFMFNCDRGIDCLTDGTATADSNVHLEYINVQGVSIYNLQVRDTNVLGGFGTRALIENYHTFQHSDDSIIIDGNNSDVTTKASSAQGDGTGNAITLLNGGNLFLQAFRVQNWGIGVNVPLSSGVSNILAAGVIFDNCTINFNIIPLTTTGNFTGYTEYNKAVIPKSAPFFITNEDQRIITVGAKGANFTSIADALAAITDNGFSSRYTIQVGPGIFVEPQLVMKDYVSIIGIYRTQTLIVAHPSTVGVPFIKGSGYGAVSNVSLGVANYALAPSYLVEFLGHPLGIHFRVDNTIFDTSEDIVHIGSTDGDVIFLLMDTVINVSAPFTRGVIIEDSGPSNFPIKYLISNLVWSADITGLTNFIELYNIQSFKSPSPTPNIFGAITDSSAGEGLNIAQGAMCTIAGSVFAVLTTCLAGSFVNGLIVANSAEVTTIIVSSSIFINNTIDIDIQSPIAVGSINATATISKVLVNPLNTTIGIVINDPSGAVAIGGPLFQGDTWDQLTNISSQIQHASTTGVIDSQPTIASAGGLNVSVAGGEGYVFIGPLSDNFLKFITWAPVASLALPDNALSFIYVDQTGTVSSSVAFPDPNQNIILGNVRTFGGLVEYVQEVGRLINNLASNIDQTLRDVFGPIVSAGLIATPGSSAVQRAVAVSSGTYNLSVQEFNPVAGDNVSMIGYFGGTSETAPFTNIPLTYDNAGVLTPIPAGMWVKHSLHVLSSLSGSVQYFLVFGQQLFASELLAGIGPIPVPPSTFRANMVPVAGIVLTDTDPSSPLPAGRFLDIRPTLQFRSTGVSSSADHNSLLNLAVGDAHPQYFRTDGTRVMAGNIQLGTFDIVGAGGNLLNSVDITAHEARHLPGGPDALVTGVPVSIGSANAIGAAASFSRSDHVHSGVTGIQANGGPVEPGTINLVDGSGVTIVDAPPGTFTFTSTGGTLAGDVTGPSSANTVAFVGGSTAADVNSATILALAATPLNTASTIVRRDASGNFAASTITANDFTAINPASGNQAFNASVTGDSVVRYNVASSGEISWSTGAAASDVRLYRSTANTLTIDNGVVAGSADLEVAGNERIGGYSKIGALVAPLNVTAGDITGTRIMIGNIDTTFSPSAGKFMIINGSDTTSGANSVLGIAIAPTFGPTSTASGVLTGTQLSAMTTSNNAITGTVIGATSVVQLNGAGDVVNSVGVNAASLITGNSASTHGMLTVTVGSSGGTGYTAGDTLNVSGPPEANPIVGTVTVLTVNGSGTVLTVAVAHPGKGYTVATDYATSGGTGTGALITVLTRGSTTIGSGAAIGLRAQGISAVGTFTTPAISVATGIQVIDSNVGSGPASLTTQNGIDIQALNSASTSNTGLNIRAFTSAATTNLGININAFTSTGTTNVGLRIATPSGATNNYALQFVTQSTTPSGGIQFGSGADAILANMYRTATGRLRTDGEFQAQHYLCVSGAPSVVVGAGAGATGTATLTANGTDSGMQVTVVVSGSLAAAANATIFTLTYAAAYSSAAQFVVFSEANAAAASLALASRPFVSANTVSTFTFRSNATAIPVGTYIWNFSVRA